jgi:methylphosphonate synthase
MTGVAMATSSYLQRTGATFRGLINDLKRNEQAAADELGVEVSLIRRIIAGECPVPMSLIETAVRVWPVNERDFFPMRDGSPEGVTIMRAADSAATSRVFQRAGRDYYEYRDTAMNPIGMIRPEWIRILQPVNDCEAHNPQVQWNNGHFLYQFTYFIGEVNYYYEFQGQKRCARMETGDSVFGLPFARHSFATRQPAPPGLILALTYGGRLLGDAQHELGVLGNDRAAQFVLASDDFARAQGAVIAMHMGNAGYSPGYLAAKSGLEPQRVDALLSGEETADAETLSKLALALRVPLVGSP